MGKIAEGEEITVSYVDYLNLSEERQRLLKTQYYFDCTCENCKNKTHDDVKMGGKEVDGVKVCVSEFTARWQKGLNACATFRSDGGDKNRMTCEKQNYRLF